MTSPLNKNWTITVDYVQSNAGPESGWEATLAGDAWWPGHYEAGDVAVLLARVAADLRTEVDRHLHETTEIQP